MYNYTILRICEARLGYLLLTIVLVCYQRICKVNIIIGLALIMDITHERNKNNIIWFKQYFISMFQTFTFKYIGRIQWHNHTEFLMECVTYTTYVNLFGSSSGNGNDNNNDRNDYYCCVVIITAVSGLLLLLLGVAIMMVIRTTVGIIIIIIIIITIIIIILYFINMHHYYLPFTYCKYAFISISGDLYKLLAFYQILYHITLCDVYM